MTNKASKEPTVQIAILLLIVAVLAGGATAEIYIKRMWFHAGDHIGLTQAAAAIIFGSPTLFLSVGAVIVGIRAAKASEAQVEASKEQATAARAQTALAEAQLREAVRPVVSIRRGDFDENATLDSDLPPMELHNVGAGTACRLTIAHFEQTAFHVRNITDSYPMIATVLPPGQTIKIHKLPDEPDDAAQNLMIFYESVSGDRYCSSLFDDAEGNTVLNYEDSPLLWPSKE